MRFTFIILLACGLTGRAQGLRDALFLLVSCGNAGPAWSPPAVPLQPDNTTNAQQIVINDNAAATPYPSTLTFYNFPSGYVVESVKCGIVGFAHTYPSDAYVALESPAGQVVGLVCGRGSSHAVSGINLLFDDASAISLPSTLVSGTYQPSGSSTLLPSPAPTFTHVNQYGWLMSDFNGSEANGTWKLWAADNSSGDSGYISNGWYLIISLASTNFLRFSGATGTNMCLGTCDVELSATGGSPPYTWAVTNGSLPDSCYLTNASIIGSPTNAGTNTITMTVTDSTNDVQSVTLVLRVAGITNASPLPAANVGVPYSQQLQAAGMAGARFSVTLSNLPSGLAMDTNGLITGTAEGPVTNTFTAAASNAVLFCSKEFVLATVVPTFVTNSFTNAAAITMPADSYGRADLFPSTISVTGVVGTISRVSVTLDGYSHSTQPRIQHMLTVSPSGTYVDYTFGGSYFPVTGLTLVFDDTGGDMAGYGATLVSGTYIPAGYYDDAYFPGVGTRPYDTSLSAYNGESANGTWSLYLRNANTDSAGVSGGWRIEIVTYY